jgi:hypothetical protein
VPEIFNFLLPQSDYHYNQTWEIPIPSEAEHAVRLTFRRQLFDDLLQGLQGI